jgi:hypothetical protein
MIGVSNSIHCWLRCLGHVAAEGKMNEEALGRKKKKERKVKIT